VFTARRQVGAGVGLPETEWLLQWETAAAQAPAVQGLIEARPIACPRIRLGLGHVMQAGTWVPDECSLATSVPFAVEAKCPPWAAALITRCDGRRTTREHLQFLKENGAVPADAPESEFVKFVRALIAGGFLEVPEFGLPKGDSQPGGSAAK
jgi:hypothetical protein